MTVEIYGPSKTHTVSGETVTFVDDSASNVSSFVAQIDRNGLDGMDGVTISRNGTTQTVPFGKTVYEGSVNVTSGTLTETYGGGPYDPANIPSEISSAVEENMTLETASGAIAQFDCELGDYPAQNVTIAIEPVQSGSGDPSPDNVRPISGWTGANVTRTGKNLFDKTTAVFVAGGFNNGVIASYSNHSNTYLPCKPNTTYTISRKRTAANERFAVAWCADTPAAGVAIFDAEYITNSGENIGETLSLTITTGTTAKYLAIWAYWSGTDITEAKNTLQVQVGSSVSSYEAYQGTTIPITFPTPPGTVYGGTLDVTNGVLTVTHKGIDMGTLSWSAAGTRFFSSGLAAEIKIPANNDTVADLLCSVYSAANYSQVYADTVDSSIAVIATPAGSAGQVSVRDHSESGKTGAEFKTAMSGVQFVYELATPQTYQLSPQEVQLLKGENNLWADTGDSTVEYYDGDITSTDILTESGALISGKTAIYPLDTPLVSSITPASVPTVSGTNVMSANTGSITVSWATHWFDITPWIAWQGLTFSRNDVDAPDAGRDMSGYMHRGRVAIKEKMNINTVPLNKSQVSTLQSLLKPATIQVRVTPYPETNATKAMYMYSNNVKTTYIIHRESGEDIQGLSFPLIEL